MMDGFEYGNTRLRARHAARLTRADYQRMLESAGLEPMLGALSDTTYTIDVEAAVARHRGPRRLHEAINVHLVRQSEELRSFYNDAIGRRLNLADLRWDVRNLLALFRAKQLPGPSADLAGQLVPAGRLGAAELNQLTAQPDLRSLVDLLAVWQLPDPRIAHDLRRAIRGAVGDAARLEAELFQALVRVVDEAESIHAEDALVQVMAAEVNAGVLLGALRVREARRDSEPRPDDLELATCKRLPRPLLEEIILTDHADVVFQTLARRGLPGPLVEAVELWSNTEDLPALAEDLASATCLLAQSKMRNDPLGMGVPVGFLWTKDQEARNLRLIGSVHIHGLDRSEVEPRLVVT